MDHKLPNQHMAAAGVAHTPEEGFDHGEPNAAMIALIGGAIVIVVVVVMLAVTYLYDMAREQQLDEHVAQPVSQELLDLRAKEDSDLYRYKYIDRNAGTVRLPVDRAMELLIKEAAEGKLKYPTAPAPIKTAAELAAAAAAPAGAAPKTNATPAAK